MTFEILLLVGVSGVLSLIGGVVLLAKKRWSPSFGEQMVSFAAGVLLTVAFIDLFPEAARYIDAIGADVSRIFLPAFLAMLSFFVLERLVLWYHHHHEAHGVRPSVVLIVVGDSIHNFIDGVAIAASFFLERSLGYVTTLAVAMHEIPQEMADVSVMRASGISRRKTLALNVLSSLTAVVGAGFMVIFASAVTSFLPYILSFTAGMFIYIASSDLIPELHHAFTKRQSWVQLGTFFIGIFITMFSTILLRRVVG